MAAPAYDAVIVGSGPNGLAAAITLAQAGHSVLVIEGYERIGGGCRSAELTLPGFVHDVCSAIHPLALASPFFRSLPLAEYGVEWIHAPAPLAHPLPGGTAAVLERSLDATGHGLGADGAAYQALMEPLVTHWEALADGILAPLRPLHQMRHPMQSLALAAFARFAPQSACGLAKRRFGDVYAPAMLAGIAAHAMLPLETAPTAVAGIWMAALGHAVGWPLARGGSQAIVEAMTAYLRRLGGEIVTGWQVESLDELPASTAVLCDVTPRQLVRLAGNRLPANYAYGLQRFRYGPGVCKVDFALDGPIPWTAPACSRAGTVHVGGTMEEIAASERAVWRGELPERPFVLLAQQSLFDATRAPEGKQTVWAYCHVPSGSPTDMSARIEAQIERFAPGFRERVLARHVFTAADMERYNPNYIGGDINGGVQDLLQLFTRPTVSLNPYVTPAKGVYLCSSSTPPGGGVHGMAGYFAARAVLRGVFGRRGTGRSFAGSGRGTPDEPVSIHVGPEASRTSHAPATPGRSG